VRVVGRAIRWLYGRALLVGSLGLALLLVLGFGGCVVYGGYTFVSTLAADDGGSGRSCAAGYSQCLDRDVSDYDCSGGSGNGPRYVSGSIDVTGSDPFDLDRDGDGVACE